MDKSGYIAESNESNNTAISSAITVVLPPPDLTVTSVSLSSGTVQAGNSVDVTYTVKNQGTGSSKAVSAGIYLSTTQTGTSTYLNRGSVPVLSAGGQSSLTTQVTIPSATTAGSYYIVVYADYTNAEPNEINESNNITGKAVTIIRFTVTGVSVTVTPSSLNEGEIMTKSVTITGTGGGTVNYRWEDKNPGS